jgi:hypothetical protein
MPCLSRGLVLAVLSNVGAGAGVLNEALPEAGFVVAVGFTMLTDESVEHWQRRRAETKVVARERKGKRMRTIVLGVRNVWRDDKKRLRAVKNDINHIAPHSSFGKKKLAEKSFHVKETKNPLFLQGVFIRTFFLIS